MCGKLKSESGGRARGKVEEGGVGGLEGQVRQGQPQVARLEVETGDEEGLGDERLVEEGEGQEGPDHQTGVHGCQHEWRDKPESSGPHHAGMCNECVEEPK